MNRKLEIIWSPLAKDSLKEIFLFHKKFSESSAIKLKNQLVNAPKSIHFSKQYQIDDINPNFRRIIVGDYKILYKVSDRKLLILDIFCTLQSPEKLSRK